MNIVYNSLYNNESSPSMVGYCRMSINLNGPTKSARVWLSRSVYDALKSSKMLNISKFRKVVLRDESTT